MKLASFIWPLIGFVISSPVELLKNAITEDNGILSEAGDILSDTDVGKDIKNNLKDSFKDEGAKIVDDAISNGIDTLTEQFTGNDTIISQTLDGAWNLINSINYNHSYVHGSLSDFSGWLSVGIYKRLVAEETPRETYCRYRFTNWNIFSGIGAKRILTYQFEVVHGVKFAQLKFNYPSVTWQNVTKELMDEQPIVSGDWDEQQQEAFDKTLESHKANETLTDNAKKLIETWEKLADEDDPEGSCSFSSFFYILSVREYLIMLLYLLISLFIIYLIYHYVTELLKYVCYYGILTFLIYFLYIYLSH